MPEKKTSWPGMLIAALMTLPAWASEAPDIVGAASDPDTGSLLYLEHYYCDQDALNCSVLYLRPDESLIASKQINYQNSLQAPQLVFKDLRNERELRISPPQDPDLVFDAGFDNFVRLRWDSLEGGKAVKFPFLLLDRDKPITMRASEDREQRCRATELCLQVRLDSWLLAALIEPIELTYDRDDQRLRRFKGLSNLKSDSGKSQQVEILYNYRDEGQGASEYSHQGGSKRLYSASA
ncbi:MAG: hypothetical protein ABJ308_05055 [Halieaceae bacterium]